VSTAERWRCLKVGCNPVLNETTAAEHSTASGHRVARWPVRSAEGQRRAQERNQSGYYDKYNRGYRGASGRGCVRFTEQHADHEAMSEWEDSK